MSAYHKVQIVDPEGNPIAYSRVILVHEDGSPIEIQDPIGFLLNGPGLGITGLTGGGATKLDGIVTLGLPNGKAIYINDAGDGSHIWELADGTAAESVVGGIVRPDDYAESTNERNWIKQI